MSLPGAILSLYSRRHTSISSVPGIVTVILLAAACTSRATSPADDGASSTRPSGEDTAPAPDTGAPADSGADTAVGADTSGSPDTGADSAAPADPCAGLALCDGFEGPGGTLDPAVWTVATSDCSGSGTLTVDDTVAHGGTRSVRVDGGGGYCDHVFLTNTSAMATLSGGVVHGRLYVRFAAALGDSHVTFLSMPDANDGGAALRMGGQKGIFMWNRASDDATLPVLSPAGIATSGSPVPGEWSCVEFAVDPAGRLQTWVDGAPVAGLTVDGEPTDEVDGPWLSHGWAPDLTSLSLGWESYAGQSMTLWIDDVALSAAPIGCG